MRLYIYLLLLLSFEGLADFSIIDPIFNPPNFTTTTRPTCPSDQGCIGYNSTEKALEYWDSVEWKEVGTGSIKDWVANELFKKGAMAIYKSGLYRAKVDTTKADFRTSYLAGDWEPIGAATPGYFAIDNLAVGSVVSAISFDALEFSTIQVEIFIRRVAGADRRLSKRLLNIMYDGANWVLLDSDQTTIQSPYDGVTFALNVVGNIFTLKYSTTDMGVGYDTAWSYAEYFVKPIIRGGM